MKKLFFTMLLFAFMCGYGQGYYNHWFFGNNAGLDFSSGSPIGVGGNLSTDEGCSSISDGSGNLLFYTDGITVWNKNFVAMPNGTGLFGNTSSTQSALIVPKPGSTTQYFIITTPVGGGAITYSIADMTLAGGLGDITATKNVVLHAASTERVTAIRLINCSDFWIIGHEPENNVFFAYKLTSTGFSASPVLSAIGSVHSGASNYIGYLRSSHNGNKLAIAIRYLNLFEIFDFNKLNGVISNAITFPSSYPFSYGMEFSPDDSRLYVSGGLGTNYIYQINMNAGSNAAIISSSTLIKNITSLCMGALQLGPDNKIYSARWNDPSIGVINAPNLVGTLCNFVDSQVVLSLGSYSFGGLPNFFGMNPVLSVSPGTTIDTSFCQGQTINLSGGAAASYTWSNGSSDSLISVSTPGIYWVKASNDQCFYYTDSMFVTLNPLPNVNLGRDTFLCPGQSITLNGGASLSFNWSNGSTMSSINVSTPGTYWLQVNNGLCSAEDSILIAFNSVPKINFNADTTFCLGESLKLSAANPNSSYLWQDNSTNSTLLVTQPGTYWVLVSNNCGVTSDTINAQTLDCEIILNMPNIFTPNGDGTNDYFIPDQYKGIKRSTLKIFNRWGEELFFTDNLLQGWNGLYKGIACTGGTYYWFVQYITDKGDTGELKGFLTLMN
jgi:gliding motility-associated-like protein